MAWPGVGEQDGSTVVLNNIYVETAGKLYRSCGQGCSSSAKRTVMASNIVAIDLCHQARARRLFGGNTPSPRR